MQSNLAKGWGMDDQNVCLHPRQSMLCRSKQQKSSWLCAYRFENGAQWQTAESSNERPRVCPPLLLPSLSTQDAIVGSFPGLLQDCMCSWN